VKPRRDSRYLQWIRTLPCAVCGTNRNVEAAHTGAHGLGQKSPDSSAIPLCIRHHRTGADSYHELGARRFAVVHDLNIPQIVARLNTKPVIRVVCGRFIGSFGDELYVLGSTQRGLPDAIRKVIQLRRTMGPPARQC
jgi:hypothetical protein